MKKSFVIIIFLGAWTIVPKPEKPSNEFEYIMNIRGIRYEI